MPNAQMPMQQQQMSQTMYQPVGHMSQADTSFTPEEKEQINRRAQKLAQSTPRTALDKIRNNLQNMSPEQRQHLMNQNVDPLAYFFHDAATKQFIAAKANIQAQGHLRQGGMPPTGAPMPQQTRPMSQNSLAMQGQQAAAVAVPQGFEPSFLGNMNQILGQQQDALRSQEAGHLVVPASDSQKLAQAQQQRTSYHGTPQQKMDGQVAMPRPMSKSKTLNQPQQQFFDTQQLPQGKAQHAVQLQTQAHAQAQLQARMNAQSHAQQLQGQVGGLGNHLGPRPAQQPSPAMSMLNRPLNQQSQLQGTSQQRPQQQTPNMGQMKSQEQAMVQQPSQQAPQQNLPQGPQQNRSMAAIHQQLANLPEDRRRVLVAQWQHQRQQQQQQQLQLQQQQQQRAQPMQMNGMQGIPSNAVPMQNQQSQSGQIPPQALPPGQVKTNQPASVSSVNALQRPPSAQRQPQAANIKQQLGQQHRDQAQQQEMMRRQNMQQRRAAELTATSLTEDQAREMDKVNFPAGILNANNALSQLPANVSTWGQLISWVAQNAHSLPAESLGKLRGLQGLHYQNISNNQQRNMAQQMSHGPPGAQQNIPMNAALQAQSITSRNTQPLMQATNIPQMVGPSGATSLPPPTTQEIQAVRARLPEQGKTATDDQVRAMILRRRQMDMVRAGEGQQVMTQQQAQYMAMQRAQQQQSQQQQLQRQMVQTPSAQLAPPPQLQPPQQPPVSRVPAGQNNEKTPRLAQQSRQALQAQSQGQTVQKGVKRSNDDVVEVPNPNLTQQKQSQAQQQHQPQTSANPQNLNQHRLNVPQISAQQMSSMPRQQRAQFEEMKRQAAQRAQATPQQQPINGTKPESQVTNEHQRNEENMRKDARLKQIVQEVLTSTPKRAPLPLNPQIMATMAQQLRDAKEMVTRMEQSLPMFFRMFGDENTTRELIRTVCLNSFMGLEGKLTTSSDCCLCNSIVIKSTTLGIILPSLLKSLKLQS